MGFFTHTQEALESKDGVGLLESDTGCTKHMRLAGRSENLALSSSGVVSHICVKMCLVQLLRAHLWTTPCVVT